MKIKNNYKIAIAFTVLPFVISRLLPFANKEIIFGIFFFISILSMLSERFGCFLHDLLSKIGAYLGNIIARIILFFVWCIAVMPTGFLMKIMKRDRLKLKKENIASYWVNNTAKNTDYEYQF